MIGKHVSSAIVYPMIKIDLLIDLPYVLQQPNQNKSELRSL